MEGIESSIEDVNEVTRQATVRISADIVAREYDSALLKLGQTAKLKGFRAGKAPRPLLEKMHGKRVRLEVANRLISDSLGDLLKELEDNVIGTPEIELSSFEPGKHIEYTANISLFPNPEIGGYDHFEISIPKREVKDSDIDKAIENICQSKATHRKIESRDEVQSGDVIDALLEVNVPGQESSQPEPLVIGLGEGHLPEQLEHGILGMKVGETKEIIVELPEDHPNQELRGKTATYKVELNSISDKILPELDDNFVKSLGFKEVQTVIELRLDIRKRLEEEQKKASSGEIREGVLEQLLEQNDFMVPQVLIDDEIRNLVIRNGLVDMSKVKDTVFPVDEWREAFGEIGLKRVKMAIIVDRVAEKEELGAKDEDLDAYVAEVSEANDIPVEEVKKFFLDKGRLVHTMLEVTRNKVLDFLEQRTSINYVEPDEEKDAEINSPASEGGTEDCSDDASDTEALSS
jgi:trigger factor